MPVPIDLGGRLPEFHDDLLLVKLKSIPIPAGIGPLAFGGNLVPPAPLAFLERSGFIRRIVPLGRRLLGEGPSQALSGTASMMAGAGFLGGAGPSPSTGFSLVELQAGTNLHQLQADLGREAAVEQVARVPVRYLQAAGGGLVPPPAAYTMWNLDRIRWNEARQAGLDPAAGVRVAVLDTGIDRGHPDLPNDIEYVYDYPRSGVSTSHEDIIGHGTHVAGTIRAKIGNAIGINGICECKLKAYKIFGDQSALLTYPSARFTYFVDPIMYRAALAECADDGVEVVNLSIGGYGPPDPFEQGLFAALIAGGTAVVAAMGNDNTYQPCYPAAIPGVIAVGATDVADSRAYFSNVGTHIALCAPGTGIASTVPTYGGNSGYEAVPGPGGSWHRGNPLLREVNYATWQGTSMAAPHAAAAAALARAKYGTLSAAAMKAKLQAATDPVAGMGGATFSDWFGTGRLNLMKL